MEMEYKPRLDKRFRLREDNLAPEKIEAFRTAIETLQKEYPEIRGATMYGSLVRGEGSLESDIDACVFIDLSMATRTIQKNAPEQDDFYRTKLRPMPPSFNSRNALMMNIFENPTEEENLQLRYYIASKAQAFYEKLIADAIRTELQRVIKAKGIHVDSSYTKSLETEPSIMPMSNSGIGAVMDELLKPSGRKVGTWSQAGGTSARGKSRDYFEATSFARNMGPLFHLEVGGGVREYRTHLLERLQKAGPQGEKLWAEIRDFLSRWETTGGRRSIHIPNTLNDAIRTYAPTLEKHEER